MIEVTLLIGGNKGNMTENISSARQQIYNRIGKITIQSKEYPSPAWGFESDDFLNQALVCSTSLSPIDLLETIWEIEKEFGRERGSQAEEQVKYEARKKGEIGYSARQMDIDIMFYGDEVISTPLLTIPHPLISEREFVLRPLADVCPQRVLPNQTKTILELLNS